MHTINFCYYNPPKIMTPKQRTFLENCPVEMREHALFMFRDCMVTDDYILSSEEFENFDKESLSEGSLLFIEDTGQIFYKYDNEMQQITDAI